MTPTRDALMSALGQVYDPCCEDRGISVVDMGLIEDVTSDGHGHVRVDLVLTTGWCPFVATMSTAIPDRLRSVPGVASVEVRTLWDPVWTTDRLAPSARDALAMPLHLLEPIRAARAAADREEAAS
jgi:metal-sulfur cluster biosynthetic enzyme